MQAKLDLSKIVFDTLGPKDYFRQVFTKKQIYLHHTVSHPSPVNDIASWRASSYPIATCVVVAGQPYSNENYYKDGTIYQCFSSKYWAYHLASHFSGNQIPEKYKKRSITRELEKAAIGIELCNAGYLEWKNGKFYSTFGKQIPENQVVEYTDNYREKRFYHKYTLAQIETLRQLLVFFCKRYDIPTTYQEDMWDISETALQGTPGIFTHTSVRSDKTDCHPQPELVKMLMELSKQEDEDKEQIIAKNESSDNEKGES